MEISAAVSEKIATLLTSNGILSQDRLTKITIQCAQNKEKIIPELLKKDFIKEEDIAKVISRSFAIKINNITEDQIKPEVLKVLPVDFIKKEKIIPYDLERGTLKLAIAESFSKGDAKVNPKKYPDTCRNCDLQPFCRISERTEGAYAEPEDGV